MKKSILLIILITTSCNYNSEYKQSIDSWHQERIEKLKEPFGWLSLVGLHWLEDGSQSFGSDKTNDIVINSSNAPSEIGTIYNYTTTLGANFKSNANVMLNGSLARQTTINSDENGNPDIFSSNSIQFYLINRNGKLALRVKDSLSSNRTNFKGIDRFKVDEDYKITAKFVPYPEARIIDFKLMTGGSEESKVPGEIVFNFNNKEYKILPIEYEDSEEWFIVFSDKTSGSETYEACRFLYIAKADSNNNCIIDFNKSYNPPCAFTEYATCPLPPKQNIIDAKIEAGEKKYH